MGVRGVVSGREVVSLVSKRDRNVVVDGRARCKSGEGRP